MQDDQSQELNAEELSLAAEMVTHHGKAAEEVVEQLKEHGVAANDEVINEFHFLFPDTDSLYDCAQTLTDDMGCEEIDLGKRTEEGVRGYGADDEDKEAKGDDSNEDGESHHELDDLPWYLIARFAMSPAKASSNDWIESLVVAGMQSGGLYDGWEVSIDDDDADDD